MIILFIVDCLGYGERRGEGGGDGFCFLVYVEVGGGGRKGFCYLGGVFVRFYVWLFFYGF